MIHAVSGDEAQQLGEPEPREGDPPSTPGEPEAPAAVPEPSDWELFQEVVRRANAGNADALDRLRSVLDDNPDVWRRAGDLGRMTLREMIDHAAGGNRLVAESLERRLAEMRAELAGPRPSPVAALAVERVLACWLHLHALGLDGGTTQGGEPSPRETWRLKQLDQAHRRYLSALRMLATLQGRRQELPVESPRTLPMPRVVGSPDDIGG